MPYIKQKDRKKFDKELLKIAKKISNSGDLNYCISRLCVECLYNKADSAGYELYNAIVGVLECAKQEFIRRYLSPYEDMKIDMNGGL